MVCGVLLYADVRSGDRFSELPSGRQFLHWSGLGGTEAYKEFYSQPLLLQIGPQHICSGVLGHRDISHFTTTRHGGVSTGTYASMNPGV